jgi:hypothetical protein
MHTAGVLREPQMEAKTEALREEEKEMMGSDDRDASPPITHEPQIQGR